MYNYLYKYKIISVYQAEKVYIASFATRSRDIQIKHINLIKFMIRFQDNVTLSLN